MITNIAKYALQHILHLSVTQTLCKYNINVITKSKSTFRSERRPLPFALYCSIRQWVVLAGAGGLSGAWSDGQRLELVICVSEK